MHSLDGGLWDALGPTVAQLAPPTMGGKNTGVVSILPPANPASQQQSAPQQSAPQQSAPQQIIGGANILPPVQGRAPAPSTVSPAMIVLGLGAAALVVAVIVKAKRKKR